MKIRLAVPARFTRQEIGWAMELVDLVFAGRPEYETHLFAEFVTRPRRRAAV